MASAAPPPNQARTAPPSRSSPARDAEEIAETPIADRPLRAAPSALATWLTRGVLALARTMWPVINIPNSLGRRLGLPADATVVTRAADVRAVIERDEDFTIAEINGPRIELAAGPFILGFDRGEQFDRELAMLQRAAGPDDANTIDTWMRDLAAAQLEPHLASGSIDVVRDYAKPVALGLTAAYLGVAGPDPTTMAAWMRALFEYTFLATDERATALAERAAPRLRAHLDDLIADRHLALDAGEAAITVLDRLIVQQGPDHPWWDDDAVRRNISGLVVGAVDTTSKAVAHVLLELSTRPDQLADARAAAQANDLERLAHHVHESLRFRPHQPVVVRHCRVATEVGGHRIGTGRTVLAATFSARFDHREVDQPRAYRLDRRLAGDLTFGGGMHECFGRFVNTVSLPLLVGGIVALDGLAAGGPARFDGPFPEIVPITFTPGQATPQILTSPAPAA